MLGLTTEEKGFLLLPTLTKAEGTMGSLLGAGDKFYRTESGSVRKINKNGTNGNAGMIRTLMLPTFGKNEFRGSAKDRYKGSPNFHGAKASEGLRTSIHDPIYLNPSFAEMMMGFPAGYTHIELPPSETPSCRQSRKSSLKDL